MLVAIFCVFVVMDAVLDWIVSSSKVTSYESELIDVCRLPMVVFCQVSAYCRFARVIFCQASVLFS